MPIKKLMSTLIISLIASASPYLHAMNPSLEQALTTFNAIPLQQQMAIAVKPNGIASYFGPYVNYPSTDIALLNGKLTHLEQPLIDYCRALLAHKGSLITSLENNARHLTFTPHTVTSENPATQHLLKILAFDMLPTEQQHAFITLIKTIESLN